MAFKARKEYYIILSDLLFNTGRSISLAPVASPIIFVSLKFIFQKGIWSWTEEINNLLFFLAACSCHYSLSLLILFQISDRSDFSLLCFPLLHWRAPLFFVLYYCFPCRKSFFCEYLLDKLIRLRPKGALQEIHNLTLTLVDLFPRSNTSSGRHLSCELMYGSTIPLRFTLIILSTSVHTQRGNHHLPLVEHRAAFFSLTGKICCIQ